MQKQMRICGCSSSFYVTGQPAGTAPAKHDLMCRYEYQYMAIQNRRKIAGIVIKTIDISTKSYYTAIRMISKKPVSAAAEPEFPRVLFHWFGR